MFSYFSLMMLYSPRAVAKCAVATDRPALLADPLPHCTGLFVPARHAENITNIGVDKILAPAKISLIFAKLQQSISMPTGILSKSGNSRKQSPSLSNISFYTHNLQTQAITEIQRCGLWVSQWGRTHGGEERGEWMRNCPYHAKVREVWINTLSICSWLWIPPPGNFPSWSLFRLSLGYWETLSW